MFNRRVRWHALCSFALQSHVDAPGYRMNAQQSLLTLTESAALICPHCQAINSADAVFCTTPACGKALGEFRYLLEELAQRQTLLERIADVVANWVGHTHFITVHLAWFAGWAAINLGHVPPIDVFDPYPFGLLGMLLGMEAAVLTSLLLISGKQRRAFEAKQAELHYEASVKSYRLLRALNAELARSVPRAPHDHGGAE